MRTTFNLTDIARRSDLLRPYITKFLIMCKKPNVCHKAARRDGFIVPQSCAKCGYSFKKISLAKGNPRMDV